ncbi:hypothetical protein [Streptomyces griseosporeus]
MTWKEVDPAAHPFDPRQAYEVVRDVVFSPDPESGKPRGMWSTESVARGLGERYGAWAFWWLGSLGRSVDSGTVIKDLETNTDGDELEFQARRYTDILLQWRSWLEQLASLFVHLSQERIRSEEDLRRMRARGAASVISMVVERTGADEMWCGECARALAWFLEITGMTPDEAEELADSVVDAEFESWVAPSSDALSRAGSIIRNHKS